MSKTADVYYEYVRVSTRKQNPQRQYRNMSSYCKEQGIKVTKAYEDKFTGTTTERPEFNSLKKRVADDLEKGKAVTIIFDSVSRMSRNAEEGVKQYFEWFDQGVNLVFLHESTINTETYKNSLREIGMTGTDADLILEGVNAFLRKLAKNQIIQAFEQSEKEARDIKSRVIEGLEASDKRGGRPVIEVGDRTETQKARDAKRYIKQHSKRFGGELNDSQCMKCAGISRPTFYQYLKQMEEEYQKGATA